MRKYVNLHILRPEFFLLVDLREFFSDLGSRDKKSSENDQLTGHFPSSFLSRKKNSKPSKVNFLTNSLYLIFKYFIIFLKIWTGQCHSQKSQTDPQKYIIFSTKQIFRVGG